jgi:hypothetical protein
MEQDNELINLIMADKQLKDDPDRRQLYITYAGLFSSELVENIDLTSLELDDKYKTGNPSSWQKFLKHNVVKRFIDGFVDERSERNANKAIGVDVKTSDALKIKEQLEKKNNADDNSNIVVMFLPQKEYFDV